EKGNIFNRDPLRDRKLLLHKREISKLASYVSERGYSLIPLELYLSPRGLVKVNLSVAKGKKLYDKRADMAKKDAEREMEQSIKSRNRY
ncbi:MAG TPA: SsrA-binding protein, partial [Clostridiaceae bacterium]|nr:SsrA-binding protein [Clostridiaceae bacterium]